MIKRIIRHLPFLNKVFEERESFRRERNELNVALRNLRMYRDPGHFYSPIPLLEEVSKEREKLFPQSLPSSLPGIDLNIARQEELLQKFRRILPDCPFPREKSPDNRYFLNNSNFSNGDGCFLYCMLRYLEPTRIIEIGSGYSSCAILDINERCFDGKIDCHFIEPHPELFLSLLKPGDRNYIKLLECGLQDADLSLFENLKANDVLFVDSSHVAKIGSDVNHLFFTILPLLKPGVHIHFHDILYPFEYPESWVMEGRAWNEAYLLRVFLSFNQDFSIQFFNDFLCRSGRLSGLPAWINDCAGSGFWMKRN